MTIIKNEPICYSSFFFVNNPGYQWNYDNYAADAWQAEFSTCKGQQQSPINIKKETLRYNSSLKPFNFNKYDVEYDWIVSNKNLTCKSSIKSERLRKKFVRNVL